MSGQSAENLYPGVNAHLNSLLQNEPGEWESFHATLIVDLTRSLNRSLPAGYEARNERSLQIREVALKDDAVPVRIRRPQPDVTVFRQIAGTGAYQPEASAAVATVAPVLATMDMGDDPEAYLAATVIYRVEADEKFGRPVTRIELLSPTNKPPSTGYHSYREKRNSTLMSAMPLVEIDLLHQQPPVVRTMASYPEHGPGAQPYSMVVSDPRPSIHEGQTYLYPFGVDEVFPPVNIPLDGGDVLTGFTLSEAYNTTFSSTPTYQRIVDYQVLPVRFELYSPEDRQRLRQRMQLIARSTSAR